MSDITFRTCAACASALVRRPDEPSTNFTRRRTCNAACKYVRMGKLHDNWSRKVFLWPQITKARRIREVTQRSARAVSDPAASARRR